VHCGISWEHHCVEKSNLGGGGEKGKEGWTLCPDYPMTAEGLATEYKSCHSLSHLRSVLVARSFISGIWMEDMNSIINNADKILPRFLATSV
jgi:hypothetical protein